MRVIGLGAVAAFAVAAAVPAWSAVDPESVDASKAIYSACAARGEDARVCACGVDVAYAKLDPRVYKMMPKLEPLMAMNDKTQQMVGLLTIASQSGLSVADLQGAYETIRANRATVDAICKPLTTVKYSVAKKKP